MRIKGLMVSGRQLVVGALVFVMVAGLVHLFASRQAFGGWIYVGESPTVTVTPGVVPLAKGAKVTIAGSGFKQGEELGIRVVMGGVVSDIRHQVKPEPKVNEYGAFYSVWVLGNESRMLPEGAMTLHIVNADGDVIAHAPIVWEKPAKKDAKKKK